MLTQVINSVWPLFDVIGLPLAAVFCAILVIAPLVWGQDHGLGDQRGAGTLDPGGHNDTGL